MEGTPPHQRLIRFADYELDTRAGELRNGKATIRLHKQPLRLLLLLLEHPGKLVRREDLRTALWPDHTFVDFEDSLNHAVQRLREVLGDSAENPRFIETLPRLGYRFIHPLAGPAPPGRAQPSGRVARHRTVALAAGAVLALLTLVLGLNLAGLRDRLLTVIPLKRVAGPSRIESLAVLPLENLSRDPEQEYFADGMTEELITDLGKIGALRVISRTSVMRYKGTRKRMPEIARELNVDAIVEGTVQRSGNHVRITANLLHAATDRHLWGNSYEGELGDALVLQDKVARAIASEVGFKLMSQEQARPARAHPVNPQAYQACLKGKYYANEWTEEGFRKATANFQEALGFDPNYAPAYEGLAEVYALRGLWGLQPSAETYPLARAAALKALELDDGLAESHALLGQVKFVFDWDWAGAERELKRAVVRSPSNSTAHFDYGWFLTAMGRPDEAIAETRKALELDPLTPTTNLQLGWVLYYARRNDLSVAQLKKTLELAPDFAYAHMELGWNYAQKRMYPEAVAECQKAVSLMPEEQVTLSSCGHVFGLARKRRDALTLLDRLKKLSPQGYVDPYNVAMAYDGLGDNAHAMDWLERAYTERSPSLYALRIETCTDGLRSDPRFQDLLRRMNFPP
jgi:TolB-like protein/DNA-binding winged helix-turn-helix (wHTH) protein/Tfp pilus assembly protein PilF